jgi:DNA (cytosine-5)-methyltransferase 1
MKNTLLLSLFPGIDLFGKAFEQQGACVVQAQDKILGGDIKHFHPPKGRFNGAFGGSPCQDYSRLNRNPSNYSDEMLEEFKRVIIESDVDWFLHENVIGAPDFKIDGYYQQRFILDLAWFSDFSRRRVFVFGCKQDIKLNPINKINGEILGTAVVGNDARSYESCCEIQGLSKPLHLPFLTKEAKKQVIANAVPLQIGSYVAQLINSAIYGSKIHVEQSENIKLCACGCGRRVLGRAKTNNSACRKRLSRQNKCDAPG